MSFDFIESVEQLRELYDAPYELVIKKERPCLDVHSLKFLTLSPFMVMCTADANGRMDSSPRGDYPGFVEALDAQTIAIPDRPGNNRLDSLTNILQNPRVGLIFIVPGFADCLRVNGSARIATDEDLRARFELKGKLPKSVILVTIEEAYFHCANAITRANLWKVEAQQDREIMPGLGKIVHDQLDEEKSDEMQQAFDQLLASRRV